MAEVRIKIGADIKDLQKGVKDAQSEVGKLATSAKQAAGDLGGTAKSIDQIKESARKAIAESRALRASLDNAGKGTDDLAEKAAGAGEALGGGLSRAASSAASLASKLAGGLGLGLLAIAAAELQNRFVDAFTAGARGAEEARAQFSKLFATVADFSKLKGEVSVFEDRDDILRTANLIKAQIADISARIEQAGASADQADGFLGISASNVDAARRTVVGFFSESQKQANVLVDVLKEERGELQGSLDVLTEQLKAYDDRARIGQTLSAAELKTKTELEGQADALKEIRKQSEEIAKLRAQAFAAVGTPTPFVERNRAEDRAPALPTRPDRVFDERAVEDFLESQQRIRLQQEAVNAQMLQGNDIITQFGVTGAEALANIALGFERLEDLGQIVSSIVKGLARDIAIAAAKAALLTVLFPGAAQAGGGFKGIFKGLLGFGGGLGAAAPSFSQSLANQPAAVAPLGRIAQTGMSINIEPFAQRISAGELTTWFQQARSTTARTTGNIPLK
jgi:hypothetical protein